MQVRITGSPEKSDDEIEDLMSPTDAEEDYEEDLALGTLVGEDCQVFLVTISYRQPHADPNDAPRSWSLEVAACSASNAKRSAVSSFRLLESLSSRGWQREILSIEVEDMHPDEFAGHTLSPHLS